MNLSHFLHIYQPANQQQEILERVVNESYRPIIKGLKENPQAKITLNINGSLTEQLANRGFEDLIKELKVLAEKGQIEFTGSAKFHAFLPLLPEKEIARQITTNLETNRKYFGDSFNPVGFFAPEMAYSDKVKEVVDKIGYKWIVIDEIAYCGKNDCCDFSKFHKIKNSNLVAVFRQRKTSNIIMSAVVRSAESLKQILEEDADKNIYILTAMDGETFGHHRPGHDKILFEMLKEKSFQSTTISDLISRFPAGEDISPIESTWASSEHNIEKGMQFFSWKDPGNIIHKWQWEYLYHVLNIFYKYKENNCPDLREKMDEALASDPFWWASAKPWWSLEMIELGAWRFLDLLNSFHGVSQKDIEIGKDYYSKIVLKAFEWQRTGYIRELAKTYQNQVKAPFKERTVGEGKPEVYDAFIYFMKKKMLEASEKENYERAILWRDAIWKLETKNDIYDAIHATDLLRVEVSDENLKKIMEKYKKQYKKIKGGQPEDRVIL